jgi:hypothetical protein
VRLAFALLVAGCTIDPVARAELAGTARGEAIFQQAGTTDQTSYELTLAGPDGSYVVYLADGGCDGTLTPFDCIGALELRDGTGVLRGVSQRWGLASGDNDIVGRVVVVEQSRALAACGEIFNSD